MGFKFKFLFSECIMIVDTRDLRRTSLHECSLGRDRGDGELLMSATTQTPKARETLIPRETGVNPS